MSQLQGRTALVTGGGSGLGRAISTRLAAGGATVLVADVNEAGAKETASRIADAGGRAEPLTLDITDSAAVDDTFARVFAEYGERFDCLINNAGTDKGADLPDVADEQWHAVFGVNLHGPMHVSRAFVRGLLERGAREVPADILNVVSISALTVGSGAGAYNSSKAALLKFTEVLQSEARERAWPVRVTALHPAAMNTPMMDQWNLPAGRMMDPDSVARVVEFAVSLPADVVLQSAVVTPRVEYFPR